MKNLRILAIFLASAILISCSKENLTLSKSNESTISTKKAFPVPNYGGLVGVLTPNPDYGALKFYNEEENFVTSCQPDGFGSFKIGTLIPGTYRIMIKYIPEKSPTGEYMYLEIRGIIVESGIMTDLGEIKLPKE
jgi:hypothetical protein